MLCHNNSKYFKTQFGKIYFSIKIYLLTLSTYIKGRYKARDGITNILDIFNIHIKTLHYHFIIYTVLLCAISSFSSL